MTIIELKELCEHLIAEGKGDYKCISDNNASDIRPYIDDKSKEMWL